MAKTVKVGNFYIEVPDDHILANSVSTANPEKLSAEKPDPPSKPADTPYIYQYQPNDPFRASIDRVEALSNIDKDQKPWVRKTFFFFFVLSPLLFIGLASLAILINLPFPDSLKGLAMLDVPALIVVTPFFILWRRAVRRIKPAKP